MPHWNQCGHFDFYCGNVAAIRGNESSSLIGFRGGPDQAGDLPLLPPGGDLHRRQPVPVLRLKFDVSSCKQQLRRLPTVVEDGQVQRRGGLLRTASRQNIQVDVVTMFR